MYHHSDFKLYYRTVVKNKQKKTEAKNTNNNKKPTLHVMYKNRYIDKWNRMQKPYICIDIYGHLIFSKDARNVHFEKQSTFNKKCWSNCMLE